MVKVDGGILIMCRYKFWVPKKVKVSYDLSVVCCKWQENANKKSLIVNPVSVSNQDLNFKIQHKLIFIGIFSI